MDKVLNFEEEQVSEEEINEEEELEDNEMTAEEFQYYKEITMKNTGFDLSLFQDDNKQKKKKREKKNNKIETFDLFEEPKSWKSDRADKKRFKDGKVRVKKRKFNPRPLPLNWDDEKGCEIIKTVETKQSFPVLGLGDSKKVVKKPKVSAVWAKMMKKKKL